jgi:hypothetical protein
LCGAFPVIVVLLGFIFGVLFAPPNALPSSIISMVSLALSVAAFKETHPGRRYTSVVDRAELVARERAALDLARQEMQPETD